MSLNVPAGPNFPPRPGRVIDMEERPDGSFAAPGTPESPEAIEAIEAAHQFQEIKSAFEADMDALDAELVANGYASPRELDDSIGARLETNGLEYDAVIDRFNSVQDDYDDVKARVYKEMVTLLEEVRERWRVLAGMVRSSLEQPPPPSVDSSPEPADELGELTAENKNKWLEARQKELAYFLEYESKVPAGVDLEVLSPQLFSELKDKRKNLAALLQNIPYLFADSGIPVSLVKSRIETIIQLKRTLSGIVHQFEQLIGSAPGSSASPKEVPAAASEKDPFAEIPYQWLKTEAREIYDTEKDFLALTSGHPDIEKSSKAECDEVSALLGQSKNVVNRAALTTNSDTNQPLLNAYKTNLEKNRRRLSELMLSLGQKVVAAPPEPTPEQKNVEKNKEEFENVREERALRLQEFKAAGAAFAAARDEQALAQAQQGEISNYFGVQAKKSRAYLAAEEAYLKAGTALRDSFYKKRAAAAALKFSAPIKPAEKLPDTYLENKEDRVMFNTLILRREQAELKAREDALNAERENTRFGQGLLLYDKVKASIAGSAPMQMVGTALYGGEGERRADGKMLLRGKLLLGGVGALAIAGGGALGLGAWSAAWATSVGVGVAAKLGTKSVLSKLFVNGARAELESGKATDAKSMRKGSLQALQKIANNRIMAHTSLKRNERIVRDVTTAVGVGVGAGFGVGGGRTWAQGVFDELSLPQSTMRIGEAGGLLHPDANFVTMTGPDGTPLRPPPRLVSAPAEAAPLAGPRQFAPQTIDVTSAHRQRGLTGILDNAIRTSNPEIYERLTTAQKDRLMSEVFRQVQNDPALLQRVGVRSGNVNLIIAGRDRINVHELLRIADERATAIRGVPATVPPPPPAPAPLVRPRVIWDTALPQPQVIAAAQTATEVANIRATVDIRGEALQLNQERIGQFARGEVLSREAPVVMAEGGRDLRTGGRLDVVDGGNDGIISVRNNTANVDETVLVENDAEPADEVFASADSADLDNSQFRSFLTQRFGSEARFLQVRSAMADTINAPSRTFFGFLTGANDNTADRVFADATLTDFQTQIRRPELENSGVRIDNFNRWRRQLAAFTAKLEAMGVEVDPDETTVEQLVLLAAANDVDGVAQQLSA